MCVLEVFETKLYHLFFRWAADSFQSVSIPYGLPHGPVLSTYSSYFQKQPSSSHSGSCLQRPSRLGCFIAEPKVVEILSFPFTT